MSLNYKPTTHVVDCFDLAPDGETLDSAVV